MSDTREVTPVLAVAIDSRGLIGIELAETGRMRETGQDQLSAVERVEVLRRALRLAEHATELPADYWPQQLRPE
jgi:hypothetical protein